MAPAGWRGHTAYYLQSRLPSQCWLVGRQDRSLQGGHSEDGLMGELLKVVEVCCTCRLYYQLDRWSWPHRGWRRRVAGGRWTEGR